MGPFAHPLFSAIMVDDVAPSAARRPRPRVPGSAISAGLPTSLSLNPLFQAETQAGTPMKRQEAAQPRSFLDPIGIGLDAIALATSPFPLLGDVTGLAADAFATARDPSLLNFGLMGLGALPFVPSVGMVKRLGGETLAEFARRADTPETRRAAEQGFRTESFFHGTNRDVARFDPDRSGLATATSELNRRMSEQPAAFLTTEPIEASVYAEHAARTTSGAGANVMPLRVRPERPVRLDAEGLASDPRELRVSLDVAADVGRKRFGQAPDVVFVDNLPPIEPGGEPITMAVVFDPAKIRSVFAKFDPKRASSSDLLAGLAGAGLLVSATGLPGRDE